jgi:hypothetical protein
VALSDDLDWIAGTAASFAAPGEQVTGVLAAEPLEGGLVFLCAYESAGSRAWLALDAGGRPLDERRRVREAASLAALCEVAEETAGGGDLDGLRARLAELRESEAPEGIEEAERAAAKLAATLEQPPRVARTAYLDAIGAAAKALEHALGQDARSPFSVALQQAMGAVDELATEVQERYKGPLA